MWNGLTCSSPRSSTGSGQPVCASVLAVRVWQSVASCRWTPPCMGHSVASCSRTPPCMCVDPACIAYMRPPRARELLACWGSGATGQEAPDHLRRAGPHPRDAALADRLQVHRVDEVSRCPYMCVDVRLFEWLPFSSNHHCRIGVIRMPLHIHHHTHPTGNSSLAAHGAKQSPTSRSRLATGWWCLSR